MANNDDIVKKLLPIEFTSSQFAEYSSLIKDKYLSKKYNRNKRLKQKLQYYNEIVSFNKRQLKYVDKFILDIGPGPGEFLEICRAMGFNKVLGVDANFNTNTNESVCMGNEYLSLSKLMVSVNKLNVLYTGLEYFISNVINKFDNESILLINSQGSFEQAFSKFIIGDNFRGGRNVIEWDLNLSFIACLTCFIGIVSRVLVKDGMLVIWMNGTKNQEDFNKMFMNLLKDEPLKVVEKREYFYKIKKL